MFPNAIADYVESIGPYRLMSGVNIIPVVSPFVPQMWTRGRNTCEDALSPYMWESIIHPRNLVTDDVCERFNTQAPLDEETEWGIYPSILSKYRDVTARLSKKTPCRLVSSVLAGRPTLLTSTTATCELSRSLFCCEEQPCADVKKSCILNYHKRDRLSEWPKQNRRLLRPFFECGSYSISTVLESYNVAARID